MSPQSSKPSIFTSRESFHRKLPEPPHRPGSRSSALAPGSSSPLRRQSTPDYIEKNRVQSAATPPPLPIPVPSIKWSSAADVDEGKEQQLNSDGKSSITTSSSSPWAFSAPGEAADSRAGPPFKRSASFDATAQSPISLSSPPSKISWAEHSGRKRTGSLGPTSEPARKRAKLKPRKRHYLDTSSLAPLSFDLPHQPASPLFFSNSPNPRPSLPPRFSSSEAGAKMLSKARTEDSHVKTVSLARGVVSTPQAMPSNAQPQNTSKRKSLDRSNTGQSNSPESNYQVRDPGSMLNSIGITELLDHDERPTFVIDVGESSNYGPGQLHLLFVNVALRSYPGLENLVCGKAPGDMSPGTQTHLQFKSWLLSAVVDGVSLNVCLPSLLFAGLSWTCSTLRQRLRIISGICVATPNGEQSASLPPSMAGEMSHHHSTIVSSPRFSERADYFGAGARHPKSSSDSSSSAMSESVSVIEPLPPAVSVPATRDPYLVDSSTSPMIERDRDLFEATQLLPPGAMYVSSASSESIEAFAPSTADNDSSKISTVAPEAPSFDWTRLPITDAMPSHIRFARSVDWAATSLGPIESWSSDLRQMCNLIMASPHPCSMYWGEDLIAIYNEAYILLAGQKHPSLMGRSYRDAWQEIWDEVKEVFANARLTGEATMKDDDCLFIKRTDYLEETYFSWSIIPMVGRDGSVMGLYNPAFEKTRRKIAERRMLTLREVGERTASARDLRAFWAQVLGSFEFNEYDSPFLMLYSVADESDSDTSSIHSNSVFASRQCFLEGALGVPEGHRAAPEQIDLKSGMEGFGPVFREIVKTDKPMLLDVGSRDLPEGLLQGLSWRGFGDPVRAVVCCPIHPTTGESVLGFLVLGVNPRRPYDDDYALFVQLLSRQLATSLASVVLFEEEIRRGQRAAKLAALDRIELSEQLVESETKFARMAEFAPVGMFITGSDGRLTFCNDTFYDISRVPKNDSMADTWMEYVIPEDQALVKQLWDDVVVNTKSVSSEFRFKAKWEDRNGIRGDTWVLFSAYPEKDSDGKLKSIFGSITNISSQKWAENIQMKRAEEAYELKRQQENFIDRTSHELRNPMSAIVHCSDEIANSLTKLQQTGSGDRVITAELLSSCLDAAHIISLCSQHQKRIVDDVLTLSKLDAQLVLVTPVDAQPLTVVQRALKMHEGELQATDIQMKLVVEQSYHDLSLDWMRLDPTRLLQILINLTTNAIKFTASERKRSITVTIGASTTRPSERKNAPVKYFPTRSKRNDVTEGKDWGEGEKVYIHFIVSDTGRGLNQEEKKMLFLRFSQTPRTHVQYGGSGLGLFISRELTEMQGGQIGVESEAGIGSTFSFYIAARKSSPPDDDDPTGMKTTASWRTQDASSAAVKEAANHIVSSTPGVHAGTAASTAKPSKPRVLIVEDNLVNQRVLQKQLKNLEMEVQVANHGGEALERLRRTPANGKLEFDVVLMDQEMPVMDGLTCTRKLRELEKEGKLNVHIPILGVTANARDEQVSTALAAGMDDVVSKPFRIPELVAKIEELMEKFPASAGP